MKNLWQDLKQVLGGEAVSDWPWLAERLGHLKVIEVADTLNGSKVAQSELEHRDRQLE